MDKPKLMLLVVRNDREKHGSRGKTSFSPVFRKPAISDEEQQNTPSPNVTTKTKGCRKLAACTGTTFA